MHDLNHATLAGSRTTHRIARTRLLAAAGAAALLLATAGCGTADDASGAADSPATTAAAADASAAVTIDDAWVRATVGTTDPSMTAAFMVVENHGAEDVTLTGASSPVAPQVMLHEMVMKDDEMVMQEVMKGITITAGRGKMLMPGGYHVMLMGLTDELAPGDEVDLSLTFSDGSSQEVTAPVKEFTEEEGHYHEHADGHTHDHGDDDHDESPSPTS